MISLCIYETKAWMESWDVFNLLKRERQRGGGGLKEWRCTLHRCVQEEYCLIMIELSPFSLLWCHSVKIGLSVVRNCIAKFIVATILLYYLYDGYI